MERHRVMVLPSVLSIILIAHHIRMDSSCIKGAYQSRGLLGKHHFQPFVKDNIYKHRQVVDAGVLDQ
jgi:hypothetical protein